MFFRISIYLNNTPAINVNIGLNLKLTLNLTLATACFFLHVLNPSWICLFLTNSGNLSSSTWDWK